MKEKSLQKKWQRHDWQHSPFAPDLRIVQALVGGKTASGAGFSRYDAMVRCLGETAEIMALAEGEHSEGVAAGPDLRFASNAALQERLERWAIWEWWHGRLPATLVAVPDLVLKLRAGAREKRQTQVWQLPDFPHLHVIIAKSQSAGTAPILGFGAAICPRAAAQSALIELGLMELNLLTPAAGLRAYFERISAEKRRLFPVEPAEELAPMPPKNNALEDILTKAGLPFSLKNITPDSCELTVIRATIPEAPSWGRTAGPLL